VTATASARSLDRIRSYGVERIVDYTATPIAQALAGQRFDVVLHLAPTSPDLTPTSPEDTRCRCRSTSAPASWACSGGWARPGASSARWCGGSR
jgi:hypothetical protein